MANGKNYSIREQILDQYLSSGHWYSRKQLEEFCNRELEIHSIQQLAPFDITVIHKTIEHVFLTTEQAA
jgi:hypothetical protein